MQGRAGYQQGSRRGVELMVRYRNLVGGRQSRNGSALSFFNGRSFLNRSVKCAVVDVVECAANDTAEQVVTVRVTATM